MAQRLEDIVWPGWEVIDKLGEGSFGGVYEIQRTLPDGTVERAALKKLTVPRDPGEIKELYAQRYDSASITAHFHEQMQELVREYTFMQKLGENPNVVHCQDLRTIQHDDGIGWDIYIRMELLKPLKLWLDDRYNERRVIRLGLNLCSALNGCHQRNIIHRDIKPENILVAEDGRFKLGDFGIAKVSEKTATGTLTGTYGYMAPEIANRQHYGASADIYSLGLVMYWMMNERTLPFLPLKQIPSSVQRQEAQDRRFSGEEIPAPVNGTPELTRIVLKACAFDPQERYRSVRELAEDLNRHYQNLRSGTTRIPGSVRKPLVNKTLDDEPDGTVTEEISVPPKSVKPPMKSHYLRKPLGIAGVFIGLLIAAVFLINGVLTYEKKAAEEESITGTISIQETAPSISEFMPSIVYTYVKNDTGITITGYKGILVEEAEIPSEIDGLPVTGIGEKAFYECVDLRGIAIPDSVTSIEKAAFWGCSSLNGITIPDGVITIGEGAFGECTSLKEMIIPDSVTGMDYSVFLGCTELRSVVFSKNSTYIPDYSFEGCTNLTDIDIPDGVTGIGNAAFSGCAGLNSIAIPYSVTSIGNMALSGCEGLRGVAINRECAVGEKAFPDTCIVSGYAFGYRGNAEGIAISDINFQAEPKIPVQVRIPSEIDGLPVNSISNFAFDECANLSSVIIPDGVTRIGDYAFDNCTNMSSIKMPDSITDIGDYAFKGCNNLGSVTIPDGVTRIGKRVFYGCENLSSIEIPNGVTSIGEYAFYECKSLGSITIPDGITRIDEYTFYGCTNLSSITIPDGVTWIGDYAFYECINLSNFMIPDGVTWIGDYAFYECINLSNITIPDGVTSIGEWAFCGCRNLSSIVIPESVTGIGEWAFCGCRNLSSVTIPSSVASIGQGAFSSCDSLKSVTISRFCVIENDTFPRMCHVKYY